MITKPSNKRQLYLLLLIVLLVSCSRQQNSRPAWYIGMLKKPICLAPCWNNFTPGVTTRNQLEQMLAQDPAVSEINATEGIPWGPVLMWKFGIVSLEYKYLSIMATFDGNGIVQELNIREGYPLYLDDFISIYGFPEKVVFADTVSSPGYIGVDMLYPGTGLVIHFSLENTGTTENKVINFEKNSDIGWILFTKPGLEYYFANEIMANPLMKYDWKGYTTYP
jgi:hypothetical protein